jgi:hypothetical protein
MSLRIGCDLDGVLADMDTGIGEAVVRLFGPAAMPPPAAPSPEPAAGPPSSSILGLSPQPFQAAETTGNAAQSDTDADPEAEAGDEEPGVPATKLLTSRQQQQLWRHVRDTENFWESLAEIESGAVARLAELAREHRWEVLFITQRPATAGDSCQVQTQRWLKRHGFDLPSVFVLRGSRGKVASALDLDVVIDDRPENCLDVLVDSRARAILIWRGDAAAPVSANAERLGIEVHTSMRACLEALTVVEKPSLLGRIKKLIGS